MTSWARSMAGRFATPNAGMVGLGRPGVFWAAPNPGFAWPPEGVQEILGAARRFLERAPNPGFAWPPKGVQEILGAARRFLER